MGETITLSMIVKNEAGYLKGALDSAAGQVDEIVIVDTGSTDGTLDIARQYTDRVYRYSWDDDFSAARNFAVENATGEWVLSLDADEELVAGTGDLKSLVARDQRLEAHLIPLHYPVAGSTGEYNHFLVLRLFRNNGRFRFRGRIHEQVAVPENGLVGIAEGPVISHKRLPAGERNRKRGRNLAFLKKACSEDPQNPFLQYYLGVEWLGLGRPGRALPCFRKAYQELSDDHLLFRSPALRYLIISLKVLEQLDEGIALSREASLRYPDYTDIYYLGGILFEKKRDYLSAVEWFNRALRCGTPPSLYSHMNGTGSFLANYHLGYCNEMLGRAKEAKNCYGQALDANPGYIYPVYSLFLLVMAANGPRYTLDYLKVKGYLGGAEPALAVAGLFFTAGYPGLARRCLEECLVIGQQMNVHRFHRGKYNIYAGRLQKGIDDLSLIPKESDYYVQAQTHLAIARILLGRFREARSSAVNLWLNGARNFTRILFALTRRMEEGEGAPPLKISKQMEILQPALEMIEHCVQYLPEKAADQNNTLILRLISGLESVIKEASPEGYQGLIEFYQNKTRGAQAFFDYKYGPGGGGA